MQNGPAFWDREVLHPTHSSWMEPSLVRSYINKQIAGDSGLWPLDWLTKRLHGETIDRALSIGCGTGALERDLVRRGLVRRIDAFDGSVGSIVLARRAARDEALSQSIGYFVADFNRPAFPRERYDAIFFHQSLHHVEKLEKLLRAVLLSAKPSGLLYLDEAIGPSRHEWTEEKLTQYQRLYEQLPEDVRWFDYVPFPVEWNDLSEAVRSSEILAQLRVGFRVTEMRGYGGNVLAVLYPALLSDRITPPMLEWLIDEDRKAVETEQRHFHGVIVAHPKTGVARRIATLRYFFEPKLKLLTRNLAWRFRPNVAGPTRPRKLLHPPR